MTFFVVGFLLWREVRFGWVRWILCPRWVPMFVVEMTNKLVPAGGCVFELCGDFSGRVTLGGWLRLLGSPLCFWLEVFVLDGSPFVVWRK